EHRAGRYDIHAESEQLRDRRQGDRAEHEHPADETGDSHSCPTMSDREDEDDDRPDQRRDDGDEPQGDGLAGDRFASPDQSDLSAQDDDRDAHDTPHTNPAARTDGDGDEDGQTAHNQRHVADAGPLAQCGGPATEANRRARPRARTAKGMKTARQQTISVTLPAPAP